MVKKEDRRMVQVDLNTMTTIKSIALLMLKTTGKVITYGEIVSSAVAKYQRELLEKAKGGENK